MKNGFYDDIWSPVEGCLNGCEYCYARKELAQYGKSFEPIFYKERLSEVAKMRIGVHFVTHYCDLMGDWVPAEWIEKVIAECKALPRHTFLFISKNPKRYWEFVWPGNCILGVTVESPNEFHRAEAILRLPYRKMCSIEPIMGSFEGYNFNQFELVVIGAVTGQKHKSLITEVNSVVHPNIYYKHTVRQYLI